jgi:hypothetical protein
VRKLFGRSPGIPLIGVPGRDRNRAPLATAADQQRHPRLDRGGLAGRILQLEILASEGGAGLTEKRAQDLDGFLEAVHSLAHGPQRDGVGGVLVLLPARPDP